MSESLSVTIRRGLFLYAWGLSCLVLLLAGGLQYAAQRRSLTTQSKERREAAENAFLRSCEEAVLARSTASLSSPAAEFFAAFPAELVELLDSEGGVLFAQGAAQAPGADAPALISVIRSARPAERELLVSGRALAERLTPLQSLLKLETPIGPRLRGAALRVLFDPAKETAALSAALGGFLLRWLWIAAVTLLAALAGAHFLAAKATATMDKLVEAIRSMGAGHFSARAQTAREDELGELLAEFNQMGRRLGELEDLKEGFLAKITHDLRNPLVGILGFADMLIAGKRGELSEKQIEALRMIRASGRELGDLIDNILDITRLEAGKMSYFPRAVALRAAAAGAAEPFRARAEEYGVGLDLSGVPESVTVKADEAALRRVLANLISNALKFTPKGGKVSVEWSRLSQGEDRVAVKDTGIGIPQSRIPTLFAKFSQVPENLNKVRYAPGTGLGLAICKELVESHGGRVWVESAPQKGSTFYFSLPV